MEPEAARLALVDRHAKDIGGQHVARELDALEVEPQRACEHVRERCLADAGQILDEQVSAREQAREREAHLRFLAENDAARRADYALDRRGADRRLLELGLEQHAAIVLDAIRSTSMTTAFMHSDCLKHEMGAHHPERPAPFGDLRPAHRLRT